MSFTYDPKEAKKRDFPIWPTGDYPATVENAEESKSKAGNDMIKFTLKAYDDPNERTQLLFDYVVKGKSEWKLKELAESAGLLLQFESGKFDPHDYMGTSVYVHIVTEDSEQYGKRNKIKYYVDKHAMGATVKEDFDSGSISVTDIEPVNDSPYDKDIPF